MMFLPHKKPATWVFGTESSQELRLSSDGIWKHKIDPKVLFVIGPMQL
jgi:hypothetical protein